MGLCVSVNVYNLTNQLITSTASFLLLPFRLQKFSFSCFAIALKNKNKNLDLFIKFDMAELNRGHLSKEQFKASLLVIQQCVVINKQSPNKSSQSASRFSFFFLHFISVLLLFRIGK